MSFAMPSPIIPLIICAWIADPTGFPSFFPFMLMNLIVMYGALVLVAWIEHFSYRVVIGTIFITIGIVLPSNWSLTYILVGGILLLDGITSIWKDSLLDVVRNGGFLFGLAMVIAGGIVGFVFETWNHFHNSGWIIDPSYLPFPSPPLLGVPLAVILAWVVACMLFFEIASLVSVFFTKKKKPCTPGTCDLGTKKDRCII